MKQYKDLLQKVIDTGVRKSNRTGTDTIGIIGAHMQFNMADGFPAVTIKKGYWKSAVAEMLGFLRGYDNAADFRKLGCRVWDENANKNEQWLNNPYRKGEDDLGKLYGVQWRNFGGGEVDQLKKVYTDLRHGIDDRREIILAWNPNDLDKMALVPCHYTMQFGIQEGYLHLSLMQRSCDMGLGAPYNIIGYSWLLMVMAQITGLKPGNFNHFLHDVHVYEDHLDGAATMLKRTPLPLPTLRINPYIKTLEDLETWVTVEDFELENYAHYPSIKMKMAV